MSKRNDQDKEHQVTSTDSMEIQPYKTVKEGQSLKTERCMKITENGHKPCTWVLLVIHILQ